MLELTIKEKTYAFRFGMGFMREINKKSHTSVDGVSVDTGLQYAVADLFDENPIGLVDILLAANKTELPRVNRDLLDAYIDDEDTDVSGLCAEVLDFLRQSNATKKQTVAVLETIETELAKREQE